MRLGETSPSRAEFAALDQPMVPVTRRLLADGETAVGIYRKLAGNRPGTVLLESAEQGKQWSRYSFVGVRSAGVLSERDGAALWLGEQLPGLTDDLPSDPLAAVRTLARRLRSPRDADLPRLTGGLVGYLGYDVVRRLERLPVTAVDDLGMPELALMLVTDLAVLDHHDGTVLLIANALRGSQGYDDAVTRLDAMAADLAKAAPPGVATFATTAPPPVQSNMAPGVFEDGVERVREHIRAGDAFQVVLSQRFEVPTEVEALDLYRVLRATNPSPYMYLLRFAGRESPFDVVGSSPEALVTVTGSSAVVHPPAGTRPRGATPEEDVRLAEGLLADPKERAEHVMLVDLARNDLGRVCVPGSVEVPDFMRVEHYSHVMHLVSTVAGEVAPQWDALDVFDATFPAGTVSGAPKPRAMEIIESLEPTRRALYAGTVGYVDASGDLDMAIAIRTAVLHQGRAYVQAGAGVVADSDPATEEAETRHKARAVLSAIATAEGMRELP
ncbi:anthranilate synthase component I [Geodermatophilus obscurus]|uniref:Anthranilate synthase component 1 n=1 Tax=Geodermatophilus obscurus (strain ATCC 25078 / DSM 43160 / JCM 3152 / CCUG 61914 / KCC A-0152 / KCTC 9177 / NBRC 13315 / NRRL B-3577 / G-20) TaxID=526225 RepID=D2SA10_GEOOG|nr:anthranilate synthase component I [Geodermatophilus obscurus]ADB75825.1 anthranilate synthase component I [Geodermatophilus obscurus DSM 43160]